MLVGALNGGTIQGEEKAASKMDCIKGRDRCFYEIAPTPGFRVEPAQ
jgi:hypothetical protein